MTIAEPGVPDAQDTAAPRHSQVNHVAAEIVTRYGATIMRDAARYSRSTEDAEDAYQRTLEVLLTKAPSDDPAELVPWLRVVVRNQSFEVARERAGREVELSPEALEQLRSDSPEPAEVAEDLIRIDMGFEALGRLSQAQISCMLAQADGLSYDEIAERTGFTRRKVSRCLERGRQEFASRMSSIAQGEECKRLRPLIWKMMAADANAAIELRPHLRHCLGCRAILRAHESAPRDVAAMLPPAIVLGTSSSASLFERSEAWLQGLADRIAMQLMGADRWAEAATAKKAVAVAAVAVTTAGGGVAVERSIENTMDRGSRATETRAGDLRVGYMRPTMYDAVHLPPERAAKPKKTERRQSRAREPQPTQLPPASPAPQPAPNIDDGSAEFAPEARSTP